MKKVLVLALFLGILFIANPGAIEAKTKSTRSSAVIQKEIDRLLSKIETLKNELTKSQRSENGSKNEIKEKKLTSKADTLKSGSVLGVATSECIKGFVYNSTTGARSCSDEMSPRIVLVTPNGGETYYNGGSNGITLIKWRSSNFGSATVKIDLLSTQGLEVKNIVTGASNTGSFLWNVDPSLSPTAYKIRISLYGEGVAASDRSDGYFALVSEPTSCGDGSFQSLSDRNTCGELLPVDDLKLVWPNGGEILKEGDTYDIKWTGGSPLWRVRLNLVSSDMGNKPARFSSMANDGHESFTLPLNIVPDDEYYFQIERELIPQNFALNNPAFYGPQANWDYSDSMVFVKE